MEWTEVGMEAVVEKGVIDGEVYGRKGSVCYWSGAPMGLRGSLAWRFRGCLIWEWSRICRGVRIRSEIKSI